MQPFSFSYRCEKSKYLSVCVGSVCSYRSISSSVGVLRYFRSCLRSQKTLEKPTPTKIQVSLSLLGAELKKMEICAMWNHRIFHFGLDQASPGVFKNFYFNNAKRKSNFGKTLSDLHASRGGRLTHFSSSSNVVWVPGVSSYRSPYSGGSQGKFSYGRGCLQFAGSWGSICPFSLLFWQPKYSIKYCFGCGEFDYVRDIQQYCFRCKEPYENSN
nr:hypothetical protein [Zea mays]